MLRIAAICCAVMAWPCFGFTQQEASLRLPSSPAFSILNYEPSAILKPGSVKDLGADILNSFDEDGKIRMNLGMELMPYWLSSRPYLTHKKYNEPCFGQTMLQSLSISAATVRDTFTNKDKFGVGFRVSLLNGKPGNDYIEKQQELVGLLTIQSLANAGRTLAGTQLTDIESAVSFFIENLDEPEIKVTPVEKTELKKIARDLAGGFADTPDGIRAYFEAINEKLAIRNGPTIYKVYELSKKRVGLFLELAGATGFSPSGQDKSLERAGIWATASEYYHSGDAWHINARYQFSNLDSSLNNFDVGFAYTKEMQRFSIGIEGMMRWYRAEIPDLNSSGQPIVRLEKDFTYRLGFQSAYLVTDGISLNISLGKDFDSPYFEKSGFFSVFGFNYSLFKKEKVAVAAPAN